MNQEQDLFNVLGVDKNGLLGKMKKDYEIRYVPIKILGIGSFGKAVISVLKKTGVKGADLFYGGNIKKAKTFVKNAELLFFCGRHLFSFPKNSC